MSNINETLAAVRADAPTAYAALAAVLTWCDDNEQYADGMFTNPFNRDEVIEATTLRHAIKDLRNAITEHLGGNK